MFILCDFLNDVNYPNNKYWQMTPIKICFQTHKVRNFPKVKIFVDDDLIEEVLFQKEEQLIELPLDLEQGKHKLEVEHFGKTSKDTIFKNNKIIKDMQFTIKSIEIGGLDLPTTVMYTSRFVPNWKDLDKPKGFPNELKQVFTIGPNGVWSIDFETPIEEWLIKKRKIENENIKNVVTYDSYEISPHSVVDYVLTDQDRKTIKEIKDLINE